MSGDRLIRFATAAVVCAVAGFAAVVSYSHIYDLGHAHGQDGTAARLLPLSVDGLILAASLVLLHEARNGRGAPALARLMLWLGIGATVGANIAYGAGFGLLGALISAWPAVAFIGAVEMVMQLVRRARGPARATAGPDVPADVEQAVRAAYAAEPAGHGRPVRPVPPQGEPTHHPSRDAGEWERPGRRSDIGTNCDGRGICTPPLSGQGLSSATSPF